MTHSKNPIEECGYCIPEHGVYPVDGERVGGCPRPQRHDGDHIAKINFHGELHYLLWHSAEGKEVCTDCDCWKDEDPTAVCVIWKEINLEQVLALTSKIKKGERSILR